MKNSFRALDTMHDLLRILYLPFILRSSRSSCVPNVVFQMLAALQGRTLLLQTLCGPQQYVMLGKHLKSFRVTPLGEKFHSVGVFARPCVT